MGAPKAAEQMVGERDVSDRPLLPGPHHQHQGVTRPTLGKSNSRNKRKDTLLPRRTSVPWGYAFRFHPRLLNSLLKYLQIYPHEPQLKLKHGRRSYQLQQDIITNEWEAPVND